MLEIIRVVNGYLEENCYIIHNNEYALIIDPGSESDRIIKEVKKRNLNVLGILITHYHFDHIGALDDIKNEFNVDVINNKIKCFDFEIIKNPGHTEDSVSYYFKKDNILFSGDFVFKETIGNYSFDMENVMIDSLIEFKKLPKNVKVYPGHGEDTTVGYELENNPFLKGI